MRTFAYSGRALIIGVAMPFLSACGGSSMPNRATGNVTGDTGTKNNKTFRYTGKEQKFVVPAGVTQLTVVAYGGQGGSIAYSPSTDTPRFPGRVYAIIPVHPGDKLHVFVGGSGAHGGFNGGGVGVSSENGRSVAANGGGGASDVRIGGGAGVAVYTYGNYGGKGGGLAGQSGGAAGGTQSEGGSGGPGGGYTYRGSYKGEPGGNGALSLGGNGGNSVPFRYAGGGGGGDGGYYGGGGGGGGVIVSRAQCNQIPFVVGLEESKERWACRISWN